MLGSRLSVVLALAGLVVYTKVLGSTANNTAAQGTAEAVNTKIAMMEKVINSLVQRSQEAENKLHTVETQLNDVKARDEKQIQGLNTQLKSLQEKDAIITTQWQQANDQIQKLQQDKTLLIQNSAAIQAKQSLSDRKIQDLGLKQQVLDQLVVAQAGHIKQLDTKATTNLQQVTWNRVWNNHDDTDNGILETFSFIKKNAESGLRVSFYGNMRVLTRTTDGVCNRWWFELNGSECTNPSKIDGVIYTHDSDDHYRSPNVVSGICSGIPAGNVNVVFKVGSCNNGLSLGDAYTGWDSTSRIIVEEL